ncbi:MAG: gliding motility-associated C-terminal domain-containing protein [Elusimicrobia bacterium]|nr:gliding motility-associated C-terminal domain-containing protein [Elusimicrobiota bacterium]
MDSGTNHLTRNADNAGGDSATSPTSRLVGSAGEPVAFTTAASAGNTNVVRAGWGELHAFPRTVTDLGGTSIGISSVTLQWTTPGYDGHDGTLQIGSTYYISFASFTVPDIFSNHRLANISFSTNGVVPGEQVSIGLMGLQSGTTYWARIWTTDGDSNIAYESNLSSFVLSGAFAPTSGELLTVNVTSITASWAISFAAENYLLVASTAVNYIPVAASSFTAATTATLTGLDPNTTYFLGVSACPGCSAVTSLGSTITLAAPALSLSTTAVSSSTINLVWNPNGNPANTRFVVRRSTDNINFVSAATVTAAAVNFANLLNDTTYYLFVVALNQVGTQAPPSNLLVVRTPIGPIPYAPTGLAATSILLGASLTWDPLPPDGVGVGLLFYRISRSTNAGFGYVSVSTTLASSFSERPMTLGPTYYYKLSARDIGQVESPFTSTVSAVPFSIAPMEPLGVKIVPGPLSVTLSWSTTTRFGDGTPFISTAAPLADEFIGYQVMRASDTCALTYGDVSTQPFTGTSLTDVTGGLNYFYRIQAYNSVGPSTIAVTVSSLGERSYFLSDCASRVVLDDATAMTLNAGVNGIGDIRIDRRLRPEDVHDGVFQSANFTPMLNGVTPLNNYPLPKPVRIVLHFEMLNGKPFAPAGVIAEAPNVSVKSLGLFWYNGAEFKKVYGTVDALSQTVTVQSPNLGNYQIRALARSEGTVFDLSNISGRAITPNGDGLNDVVIFTYDPGPGNENVTGRIYDVMGSHVADMTAGLVPNTLVWNGRSGGRTVGSGAYIYRIQGGGKTYTGTVVVAR